jgi:hypothetical protein
VSTSGHSGEFSRWSFNRVDPMTAPRRSTSGLEHASNHRDVLIASSLVDDLPPLPGE